MSAFSPHPSTPPQPIPPPSHTSTFPLDIVFVSFIVAPVDFTFLLSIYLASLYGHRNSAHYYLGAQQENKNEGNSHCVDLLELFPVWKKFNQATVSIKIMLAMKRLWKRIVTWGRMVEFFYRDLAGGVKHSSTSLENSWSMKTVK